MGRKLLGSKVKGYDRLTKGQQEIFDEVHAKHMQAIEDTEGWHVRSVRWEGTWLKVFFENGEWLHYSPGGYWY